MKDTEYKVNSGQIAKIHVLLGQIGMANNKEYKADLVKQYTDGRETSTTKLTWKEAQDMISDLQKATLPALSQREGAKEQSDDATKADRKRKRILYYAHQMGHEAPQEGGKKKVDIEWVNNWCVKHGYLHKPLNDYTVAELSKLVWQMEQAYKAYLKAV